MLSDDELLALQRDIREVRVDREMLEYMVKLVAATRQHQHVYLGASPRGPLALFHAAHAMETLQGRGSVPPDEVKALR